MQLQHSCLLTKLKPCKPCCHEFIPHVAEAVSSERGPETKALSQETWNNGEIR